MYYDVTLYESMYVCLYIHIYIYTDIQIYVYVPRNILARPLQETFGAAEGARSRPVSDTLRFVHSGRFSMPGCYVVESKASQSHYDGPMLGWCHASAPLLMHPFASALSTFGIRMQTLSLP